MNAEQTRSFDPKLLSPNESYKILAGTVLPRPIAFVSTVDTNGVRNLAPYSFFTAVCSDPPTICFCATGRKPVNDVGGEKDTLANIRATGEFVVNIVSEDFVEQMNATAAQVPSEVDEFALAALTPVASELVRASRVGESRVQMECRLVQIVEAGRHPEGGAHIVLGEVVRFHLRGDVLQPGMRIDPEKLRAVGRMGGSSYVRTKDRFDLARPL